MGKALIPGILHYFVFLIVIMEGDLDMETCFFFYLLSNSTYKRVFTMWIILTYTVIHQLRIHVGIPTVFLIPIVNGTLFNCPPRHAQRTNAF